MLKDTTSQSETILSNINMVVMPKVRVQSKFVIPKDSKTHGVLTHDFRKALNAFFKGQTIKVGNYIATENALVYRSLSVVDGLKQDVLCIRLIQDGVSLYLGNSSRHTVVDTTISFGKRTRNWRETEPQRVLNRMGVPMLPFSAFHETGLKVTNTRIIDQSGPETVKRHVRTDRKGRRIYSDVHFTGASLFQNGNSYFLFDIDRVEIEHGIFNPFIVELPRAVNSIAEAYDSLIPLAVRTAKAEGKEVKRQGEHFFIKVAGKSKYEPDSELVDRWGNKNDEPVFKEARLSAQGNRDHVCSLFNEKMGLVSGFVKHQGREHEDLNLNSGWWKPVPNTAVKAFTISGDID